MKKRKMMKRLTAAVMVSALVLGSGAASAFAESGVEEPAMMKSAAGNESIAEEIPAGVAESLAELPEEDGREGGLPTEWDISSVYGSIDEWQADYDTVMEMIQHHEDYRGKLNTAQNIYDYFQFANFGELTRLQNKLYLYAELGYNLNPTDAAFSTLLAKLESMTVKEETLSAFAAPEIYSLSLEEREEIFSDPLFADLQYWVSNYTDPDSEPLGEEAAQVSATLSMGSGYGEKIFDILDSVELPDPVITMPDGTEEKLTNELYDKIVHSDEYDDEFKAYANQTILTKPKGFVNTFAALLEENASQAYASALIGNYETTRECAMDAYNVEPEVYDMLIDAAHEGIDDYHRYLQIHADALGLDVQFPYHMGDYVSDYDPGTLDYEDAVAEVEEALSVLGDEYLDMFRKIIESGHVDVYETDTKTTGAFETQPSNEYLPWLLFNYYGYSDDISTIAHEMGHAVYDEFSTENQPEAYASPTIFTQEVASTTNELLYYTYMMENAETDDEKLYYLENVLSMFSGTFFTQMWFAEFEDYLYKVIEDGGSLDAEDLSDKWMELTDFYRSDYIRSYPDYRYYWSEIPHFYYVYYVYQYASSVSYAASIASRITSGEEGAVDEYLTFLKLGGSAAPSELLAAAGINPLEKSTYDEAMEYFRSLVDEYERLAAEKTGEAGLEEAA